MALNNGLTFHPLDCDWYDDEKLVMVFDKYGDEGMLVVIRLLSRLYSVGYCYRWRDRDRVRAAKSFGKSREMLEDIVNILIEDKFFDREIFDAYGVLTSQEIQERWFKATARKEGCQIKSKHLLCAKVPKHVSVIEEELETEVENGLLQDCNANRENCNRNKENCYSGVAENEKNATDFRQINKEINKERKERNEDTRAREEIPGNPDFEKPTRGNLGELANGIISKISKTDHHSRTETCEKAPSCPATGGENQKTTNAIGQQEISSPRGSQKKTQTRERLAFEAAEKELSKPSDDQSWTRDNRYVLADQRPLKKYPEIFLTRDQLKDVLLAWDDSGIPRSYFKTGWQICQAKLETKKQSGERLDKVNAFSWLIGWIRTELITQATANERLLKAQER